ncbi:hypothetical protein E4T56_gene19413 [Termitomyces sp. T112]|nr:hypothetical protein C0989_008702 [Termitomyces sp. Mn162]KAG5728008.1 hypothetical protein E4T56_gene19413 [Termitomyces sp. T112]KAH0583867.1 hypothetical protein H2248_009463 [Termitomyces sp. 'cryptogamus']KNZ71758.1 GrpE like protein, mitochondrial [Termitomyces sp. J132]
MASAARALHIFRSSTTSLSSRTLARSPATRVAVLGRRYYSEDKAGDKAEDKAEKAGEQKEGGKEGESTLTPEQEKLKAKEAEVVDLTSRLRYLQADFLNLQRNAAREKEQTRDFAITRFATDLLETADVLAMALKSIPPSALTTPEASSESSEPSSSSEKTAQQYLQELHQGVDLTQRQLIQTLFKYHVKPFDPLGDTFDPNFHEALYQAPIPGKTPGTVIDVQKIGYKIKDRVLRAAQVGVAQDTS